MSKLLVIDKCAFQGIQEPLLIEFVNNYNVVLPYVLGIECLMSENKQTAKQGKDPIGLLHRVDDVVKAGAYFGRSSRSILQEEKKSRRSVGSLIDEDVTQRIREGRLILTKDLVEHEARICRQTFQPLCDFLSQLALTYLTNIQKKDLHSDFQKEIQGTCTVDRFRKWLQVAQQMKTAILDYWIPDMVSDIMDEWYTWQVIRLWWAWTIEWAGKRAHIPQRIHTFDVSNDLYDMEYVAYLSRAEGLLTHDERLVVPLAQAAFPDKDVFSSLDEVPEEYLCHWS